MQLELKHLAAYIPYGVKILDGWGDIKKLNYTHLDDENNGFIVGVKPFLRPLSDLTKEIELNGERFVPILRLFGGNSENCSLKIKQKFAMKIISVSVKNVCENCISFSLSNVLNNHLSYDDWQKLLSWHFDIFGLIDAGLAIDINTIKK